MYTINLENFKIQQEELVRQAAAYRLVRSLEKSLSWSTKVYGAVGRTLIRSGQELIQQSGGAQ